MVYNIIYLQLHGWNSEVSEILLFKNTSLNPKIAGILCIKMII